jgi:hypothetical protein
MTAASIVLSRTKMRSMPAVDADAVLEVHDVVAGLERADGVERARRVPYAARATEPAVAAEDLVVREDADHVRAR